MNKVICDICGTSYPDTAETCPICGYSRIFGDDHPDDNFISGRESAPDEMYYTPVKTGKGIFDYDAEEGIADADDTVDVYTDMEEDVSDQSREPSPNFFVIIMLVVLITLLCVASVFLFFRYFMPNMFVETTAPTMPPETVATEAVATDAPTETESAIPCERIALTGGLQTLNKEGQMWLLHVKVTPEDTTDTITYTSEDESVATVSENGRITAVAEGKTVILIHCGNQVMKCPVIVDYSAETEAVEEGTIPPITLSGAEKEATSETQPEETEASEETEPEETTQETEEPETDASSEIKDVTLKLKQFDISFGRVGVSHTLELDCDLKPEEVTWFTNNPNVALIRNGVVTALGPGTTKVFAKYGDQQVECIVRCNF